MASRDERKDAVLTVIARAAHERWTWEVIADRVVDKLDELEPRTDRIGYGYGHHANTPGYQGMEGW